MREKVLDAVLGSEIGRKAGEAIAKETLEQRTAQVAKLEAMEKAGVAAYNKRQARLAKAATEFSNSWKETPSAMSDARAKYEAVRCACLRESLSYSAEHDALEAELRSSASPLIEEAIAWCRDELRRLSKIMPDVCLRGGGTTLEEALSNILPETAKNPISGALQAIKRPGPSRYETNMKRTFAIKEMIAEISTWHRIADQTEVGVKITELRDALPTWKPVSVPAAPPERK
jgi:hypothetical protein